MMVKLKSGREIYNFCEPYIVAELASNHNGDMELAKKMIQEAQLAGADCVKFQSWSKDSIFSRKVYEDNFFLGDDYRERSDYSLEEIVEKFSISEQELLAMKRFADEVGIECTSTPFSKREVDFLVEEVEPPFIKVASMDVNHYPFLEYIAKKNFPIVLSTGLSELHEIDRAIHTIEDTGNTQIILLHCVSVYPPRDDDVNLNNIETLQRMYPYPVGFSDHTLGVSIPLASVVKGACLIEKHITLDKDLVGWDHKISATPDELATICKESKRINRALGSFRITCLEDEERKNAFRRSIVAARPIKKGEVIKEIDIDYKRPGSGFAPGLKEIVVGRKAGKDIPYDKIIDDEDLV